ncbi:hypothetical protein RCIP0046_00018 [Klebsiella phage RCIP0046]
MSKFKVGDKVVRIKDCGKDEHFLSKLGRDIYYTVTSVIGDHWLQVNGWVDGADKHPWYVRNFELYQELGDGLPPVPGSVYYPDMFTILTGKRAAGGTSGLTVRQSPYTEEAISLSIDRSKWTRLDADAALQLAHDLRRMAMEIKRKGKAQ